MATYFKVWATFRKLLLVVDEDLCAVFKKSKVAAFIGTEIDAKSENVMKGCPYKVIRNLIKIHSCIVLCI